MGRLGGKVALITGGTKGIGRGIVERFAAEGAKVTFVGRTREAGEAVEKQVRAEGGEATFVRCDLGDEMQVRDAVDATVARYGGLDALVNNAASTELGTVDGRIGDIELDGWNSILRNNLTGTFLVSKHALRHMESAGGGTVVNISSIASITGLPASAAYTACKGAFNSLTRSIATDYARAGVRCNCLVLGLHPGDNWAFYLTDPRFRDAMAAVHLTPRFGIPDDTALACVYLSSDESGFVTGTQFTIDGGAHTATRYPTDLVLESYSEKSE
jgi:NAD(P)-dependent dehydrogenase (short-subunit alcohol dehydrogenase family)